MNISNIIWFLLIFFGRVTDVALGTIRINFIVKRKKLFAAIIGFFEATIFITIIARVIQNIDNNLWGILAYGLGFATGTFIGVILSEKLSRDLMSTHIISQLKADEIESRLRSEGFGATCYNGVGKNGNIKIINVVCENNNIQKLSDIALSIDPNAFITSYMLGGLRGDLFLI